MVSHVAEDTKVMGEPDGPQYQQSRSNDPRYESEAIVHGSQAGMRIA